MSKCESVNICFFGLNRSLTSTIRSIENYLFKNLDNLSIEYNIYGAFNQIDQFSNDRTGEQDCSIENSESSLINFDALKYLDQDIIDDLIDWEKVFQFGDVYGQIDSAINLYEKYSTTKNIFRSLFCLKTAYNLIPEEFLGRPTIFLRPDIEILSDIDLDFYISLLQRKPRNYAFGESDGVAVLPEWHSWHGLNDRFAICASGNASYVYGNRFDGLIPFLDFSKHPIHPESYLLHVLQASRVEILPILSTRMARIRSDGAPVAEDFTKGTQTFHLQTETLASLNNIIRKYRKSMDAMQANLDHINQSLDKKLNDAQNDYDEEKERLISGFEAEIKLLENNLSKANDDYSLRVKALENDLSRAKDDAKLTIQQLHLVQDELEHYFLLGRKQSEILENSAKIQSVQNNLLWDIVSRH